MVVRSLAGPDGKDFVSANDRWAKLVFSSLDIMLSGHHRLGPGDLVSGPTHLSSTIREGGRPPPESFLGEEVDWDGAVTRNITR